MCDLFISVWFRWLMSCAAVALVSPCRGGKLFDRHEIQAIGGIEMKLADLVADTITGHIRHNVVEDAGELLLKNMTLLFVPTGVKIMAYFGVIKDIWWKLLLLCIVATALSFLATALVVTGIMKLSRKGEKA